MSDATIRDPRQDPQIHDVLKMQDGLVYHVTGVEDGRVHFTMHGLAETPSDIDLGFWRDHVALATVLNPADNSIEARCDIHARKMSEEGWHVTAIVLTLAAEEIRRLRQELSAR